MSKNLTQDCTVGARCLEQYLKWEGFWSSPTPPLLKAAPPSLMVDFELRKRHWVLPQCLRRRVCRGLARTTGLLLPDLEADATPSGLTWSAPHPDSASIGLSPPLDRGGDKKT